MALLDRFKGAWNAFVNKPTDHFHSGPFSSTYTHGSYSGLRYFGGERSLINAVYNQIAVDVARRKIHHVRKDQNGIYLDNVPSRLEDCLSISANVDQTPASFIQDAVLSMFEDGAIAVVPVDATENPSVTEAFDVVSMRVGKILQWYPRWIEVEVYNDRTGNREQIKLPKSAVAIVENPLAGITSGPNSALSRLSQKLSLLDRLDNSTFSGKLDLIIQLPYVVRSDMQRQQADRRIQNIEEQLSKGNHGIVYTDGAEKITQLNRPAENNLLHQIEYWSKVLYNQLGVSEEVFNGTASEIQMLNYQNKTVKPILDAITASLRRSFLSKTARSQHQDIIWVNDPFEYTPASSLVDMAEKLIRSEVVSQNEMRSQFGFRKSDDPNADLLRNPNINPAGGSGPGDTPAKPIEEASIGEDSA